MMEVAIEVSGGPDDELEQVRDALRGEDLGGAQVVLRRQAIAEGALGAEEILIFLGQNFALPLAVHALYDYLTRRRRAVDTSRLRVVLSRTDLPDDSRRVEVTIDGPADEVVKAVCKELE